MKTSDLTDKARGVARCLTYNDDERQAAAKHMLLEMAHRLDTLDVKVRKTGDGLLIANALGASRLATIKEKVAFYVFGAVPRAV